VGFASGLTVFSDTSSQVWLDHYGVGPWADTRWDEVLAAVRAAGW
jgi:hypothetical protein